MFNLDRHWMEFNCPNCKYAVSVMLRSVKLQETCYCHNCKKSINLIDNDASTHVAIQKVDQGFDKLNKALKKLFK